MWTYLPLILHHATLLVQGELPLLPETLHQKSTPSPNSGNQTRHLPSESEHSGEFPFDVGVGADR